MGAPTQSARAPCEGDQRSLKVLALPVTGVQMTERLGLRPAP